MDARTDITAQLLSEKGFIVTFTDDTGEDQKDAYNQREFEKRFFSDSTNQLFCKIFLDSSLRDPISGEIGKSIVFAVSQNHAAKLTQIFNQIADRMFPGKYHSDFAVQVTSQIQDAQQFTAQFANNNLHGSGNFIPAYKTSHARVCVTVGMMTTGYDCTDILNIGLFRPIFSPTDFIQIKGRGTRKHRFLSELFDTTIIGDIPNPDKTSFKLFDFFANCEYFETEFNYDEVLKLQPISVSRNGRDGGAQPTPIEGEYYYPGPDMLTTVKEVAIGNIGMKIDRMFFERFEDTVKGDPEIVSAVEAGQWDRVVDYVNKEVFNKPEEYYDINKLRKATAVDRRITLREILEKIFGLIPHFKTKDVLLEEEFAKFVADSKPEEPASIPAIKHYFKVYITNDEVRHIIESKQYTDLATNPVFSARDYKAVPAKYRQLVPEYVKDYVSLNQFVN